MDYANRFYLSLKNLAKKPIIFREMEAESQKQGQIGQINKKIIPCKKNKTTTLI